MAKPAGAGRFGAIQKIDQHLVVVPAQADHVICTDRRLHTVKPTQHICAVIPSIDIVTQENQFGRSAFRRLQLGHELIEKHIATMNIAYRKERLIGAKRGIELWLWRFSSEEKSHEWRDRM